MIKIKKVMMILILRIIKQVLTKAMDLTKAIININIFKTTKIN